MEATETRQTEQKLERLFGSATWFRGFALFVVALTSLLASPQHVFGQGTDALKSTLEGRVLRADSGEPIADAHFVLSPVPTSDGTPPSSSGYRPVLNDPNAVVSDREGRFVLSGIESGSYFLAAIRDGFAMQCYGAKQPGRNGCGGSSVLKLDAGQSTKDIVIRMTRGGVITGHITDPNRQPLTGMIVDIRRSGYDASGRKSYLTEPIGTVVTNDRGEYRIYGIDPGRYYINARPPMSETVLTVQPGALRVTATETSGILASTYGITFYPGVTEIVRDSIVEIQAGSELNGMDFNAQRLPLSKYRIRGRIGDSRPGQSPQSFAYTIAPANEGLSIGTHIYYTAADGTFESPPLVPGSYRVQAQIASPVSRPQPGELPPIFPTLYASTFVDLVSTDLDGVLVTFVPPVSLAGQLRIEGEDIPVLPALDNLRVRLRSADGNSPQPARIGTDGTFSIENTSSGNEYALTLTGLPPDMYVKEACYGDIDLLVGPLKVAGQARESVKIVIGANGGRVDGVITGEQTKLASYTPVVLIPDQHRERQDLFRTVTTDVSGRFSFRGIPPGDYKIFAWEDIEPYAYFDEDFISRSSNFASVHISEVEQRSVEVTINPAVK